MRTQVMLDRAAGLPWLERVPPIGGPPEQTPIASFPFTLGRNDSADLPIPSNRVSREHAVIVREEGQFRVRDLTSTNGTFVNGQRIDDSLLADGDLLLVADVEFTFFTGRFGRADRNATQVIDSRPRRDEREAAAELIGEVRRLQEVLVCAAVRTRFEPVVCLEDGKVFGYEAKRLAQGPCEGRLEASRTVLAAECRAPARLRRVARLAAAEESRRFPPEARLFLRLDACEIGAAGLAGSLAALGDVLNGRPLVVQVPDAAVSDTPYFHEFRDRLRAAGVAVAHADFAGGPPLLAQRGAIAPDYLMLAPALAGGVDRHRARQRQLQSVVREAQHWHCEVVAAGIQNEEEFKVCRSLGCRFGQGTWFNAGPAD